MEAKRLKCEHPGCTSCAGPMFINSRCHTGAPILPRKVGNVVEFYCGECLKLVTNVEVEEQKNPPKFLLCCLPGVSASFDNDKLTIACFACNEKIAEFTPKFEASEEVAS